MNIDQQTRLEIMKALEKDFPDRLLEELIDVARYVEGSEVPLTLGAPSLFRPSRQLHKDPEHGPRTWTKLDAIPSNVKAITDRDGDRAEPQMVLGKRKWFFTDEAFDGVEVAPDDAPFTNGPFTEVLEND